LVTLGKNNNYWNIAQHSNSCPPIFAIVFAVIQVYQHRALKDYRDIPKIYFVVANVKQVLAFIPFKAHHSPSPS